MKLPFREMLFFAVILVCFNAALILTARIPQEAIRGNMLSSAEWLCQETGFPQMRQGVEGSRLDRYADSILLNILWHYDTSHPYVSVMRSAYYSRPDQNENENLLEAVRDGRDADQEYLRYWHGSSIFVRPLLQWFTLEQIYIINGILLVLLNILLFLILFKQKAYVPLAGILAGYVAVSLWYVPLSLEYTWVFLLLPLCAGLAFRAAVKGWRKWYGAFFLAFGMITNYLDFLTTETLTLTIPLLLLLWEERRKGREQDGKGKWQLPVKLIVCWGIGYAGTWISKWILASAAMGENVLPYVTGHVAERIGGLSVGNIGMSAYLGGALVRNLTCLFPLEYGAGGIMSGIALLLGILYLGWVYRGKDTDRKQIVMYAVIALLPYMRYLLLHNHAYLHCFFTYRAQIAGVLAVLMILEELKVWETLGKVYVRKKRT